MAGWSDDQQVLVKLEWPHPLGGRSKEAFVSELKKRLQGRVKQAFFFGSITGENFGLRSDVDMILVAETGEPFLKRPDVFDDISGLVPRMDLLVYTPGEFEKIRKAPKIGFWKTVFEELEPVL